MPVMQGNTSVTNATESANVLAGLPYEFIQGPAVISVGATFPAAGAAGDLLATLLANNVAVAQGVDIPNVDRYPTPQDDTLISFSVPRGVVARLLLRFRNVSATTRVVRWKVTIS